MVIIIQFYTKQKKGSKKGHFLLFIGNRGKIVVLISHLSLLIIGKTIQKTIDPSIFFHILPYSSVFQHHFATYLKPPVACLFQMKVDEGGTIFCHTLSNMPLSISMPIKLRFIVKAATPVDPDPIVGSRIVSPSLVQQRINHSNKSIGFCVA